MSDMFSADWMNGFKDRWNADSELAGALEKIGFNSTIGYGFDGEAKPRGYIRVENGHVVVKPALSDPELMDFAEIGTLEAFNSDGLRSLLTTMAVPNMIEKTLRYPGHIDLIRALRSTGFFDTAEIEVPGGRIRPLDVTSALLIRQWRLGDEDDEFTVMRVVVEGRAGDRPARIQYDLFDRRDRATGFSSMARTTGFPAASVARQILAGKFRRRGVSPPEVLGANESVFHAVLDDLAARQVVYRKTEL